MNYLVKSVEQSTGEKLPSFPLSVFHLSKTYSVYTYLMLLNTKKLRFLIYKQSLEINLLLGADCANVSWLWVNCALWLLQLQEPFPLHSHSVWLTETGSLPASCRRRWLLKLQHWCQDDCSGTTCNCVCINTPSLQSLLIGMRPHTRERKEDVESIHIDL